MKKRQTLLSASGQSILEFTILTPILLMVVLGVVEVGYALMDQQVVARLTREGSNLISRDATIQDAENAMKHLNTRPVNFDDGSKLIFSVIKRGSIAGTANYDRLFLYQRRQFGAGTGNSKLTTAGGGSFNGAPDYEAVNSDTNSGLQLTNVPADLVAVKGGMIYVTELYSRHTLITPFDRFGVPIPTTLYSIAYF
jgi:hypothetical protein